MNIYNERGDMTSECVSEASGKVAKAVSELITTLLRDGGPIVEVRAVLGYIETEMKYASTLCMMEHRMRTHEGAVPIEVQDLYPICSSEDCPHRKECANHTRAGVERSLGGDTPLLTKVGSEWFCTKCPEKKGRGAILTDGTYWEKAEERYTG